jgi:hypothetical protein
MLRSPPQQVGEGQTRTAELLVEPDTEVMQSNSRCQASSQPAQLVGPLSPEAEGVEELVVEKLSTIWRTPATYRLKRLDQLRLRLLRLGG